MNKYRLLMNGTNFLIDVDGKPEKHGFYQSIFVEAKSPKEAELIAIDQIMNSDELKRVIQNSNGDPPKVILDEISEIESITGSDKTMEMGRTFYKEKRWWQIWK